MGLKVVEEKRGRWSDEGRARDTARKQRGFYYATVERFRFFRSCVCEVKQRCFIILDTFECVESSVIMLLCAFVTCLMKCITLKCLWGFYVFYKIKPEIEGVWRHWQATQGHGSCHKLKLLISLDLYLLWNIWDNVSTQFSKIYNTVLVFFGYFNQNLTYCAFNLTLLI